MKEKTPNTRNYQAIAAWFRNSAGVMAPSKKQKNKRDRANAKKETKL